jgi:hypothetical protein
MDDYRAYLVWKPDAPDSANIRARLEALQIQTGVAGPAPAVADDPEAVPTEPALIDDSTTPGTSDDGKRKATVKKTYDEEEDSYRAYDEAVSSPLRRGHGAILGVYSDFRDLYSPGSSIPNIEVGASIRYGFDGYNSLYGQLGYVDYTPSGGTASGGLALGLGYELRIRLDEMATHNFLLGALLEYQRIESSVSEGSLLAEGTANLLVPEVKVGYRLVLGHGFGIELTGDLAIPIYLASTPVVANYPEFGGSLAVLLAF